MLITAGKDTKKSERGKGEGEKLGALSTGLFYGRDGNDRENREDKADKADRTIKTIKTIKKK